VFFIFGAVLGNFTEHSRVASLASMRLCEFYGGRENMNEFQKIHN